MKENLCVLGATGSIGLNTLDVAQRHADRYRVFAVSANSDWKKLVEICERFNPKYAVLADSENAGLFEEALKSVDCSTRALIGADSLKYISSLPEIDIVMAAIVGAAGLEPNLAAVEAGKKVLLANKESLVMSGDLFMAALKRSNASLLPIDSEHNAIFQCLPSAYLCGENPGKSVRRILLTASGGPFRGKNLTELAEVTPEQACAHPNWSMGRKISVDSASLMNKGLELIEACWLFNVRPADIEVHIHPESIVHSMVEYSDGSVLAQMGQPDMRTPIAYGLAWPERIDSGVDSLDLFQVGQLNFQEPDDHTFPCLSLAREAFEKAGASCAYLNAANEIAVDAFLKGNIRFTAIPDIIENVLQRAPAQRLATLDEVLEADRDARHLALGLAGTSHSRKTG